MSRISIKIRDRLQELDETVEYVFNDRKLRDDIHPSLKCAVEAAVVYTATYINTIDDNYDRLINYTIDYLNDIYMELEPSGNIYNEAFDEYEYDDDEVISTTNHPEHTLEEESAYAYEIFDILSDAESEDRIVNIAENICSAIIDAELLDNEDFILVADNLERYFTKIRQSPVENPDLDEFKYAYYDKILSVDTIPAVSRASVARTIRKWG